MAVSFTGTGTGLAGQYQTYFNKKLLPHAVQLTVLDQFGQKVPFPKNAGAKTMTFIRPDQAAQSATGTVAEVQTLTEGTVYPVNAYRDQTYTPVLATLAQYGEAIKLTDILNWTDLFNALDTGITTVSEDVALHADVTIRNELVSTITGAGNRRYAAQAADFTALKALTADAGKMQVVDILDAMTRLTITRAPKLKGEYIVVVAPQVGRDILNDNKVVLANQYGEGGRGLMTGELGKWYGVRVVQGTAPFIENGQIGGAGVEGTYSVAGTTVGFVYRNFVLGMGAYGIPLLAGGSPFSPTIIICDKPDKSDPLNQFVTAGMKMYWTVKTLNALWAVSISSKSNYPG